MHDFVFLFVLFSQSPNESTIKFQENNRNVPDNFITRSNNEVGSNAADVPAIQGKGNREISRDYSVFSIDPNPTNYQG